MNARENLSRSKEVLGAYLRQGAHELGAALFPGDTAAQHPEYGMAFTRPPGLVTDGLRPDAEPEKGRTDAQPPAIQSPIAPSTPAHEPAREVAPPEPDLERD